MKFERASLENCEAVDGLVVVVDVVRAFTTAAYAFAAGAREIVTVGTLEEAIRLRERTPGALVMGEVGGRTTEEFDLDNSPSALIGLDLTGRRLIQRTSAGTQGVVRCDRAESMLAGCFVCAAATVGYIRRQLPEKVTFVISGAGFGRGGDEDVACADYMELLLGGETADPEPFLKRVRQAIPGLAAGDPILTPILAVDQEYCTAVDRFDFAMPIRRLGGLRIISPVRSE